jgi:hypothetical protein
MPTAIERRVERLEQGNESVANWSGCNFLKRPLRWGRAGCVLDPLLPLIGSQT